MLKRTRKNHDRAGQQAREGDRPGGFSSPRQPDRAQNLQADRHRDGEVEPGIMPGHVAIGHDPAEVLDHDRGPRDRGSPVGLHRVQVSYQSQGQPGQEQADPDAVQSADGRDGPPPGKPRGAQTATIGKSNQAWILVSRASDQRAPAPPLARSSAGDCMARAPASRASVQKRLRNVSSAARWAWAKTRGIASSDQPAAEPGGDGPSGGPIRRSPARPGPRTPARGPAGPRGHNSPVGSAPSSRISNGSPSVEAIPSSQRPSGGCSALSRKTRSTTARSKNRQPWARKVAHVRPARPHVERLVDRQPRVAQRQHHRQAGRQAHEPAPGGRCELRHASSPSSLPGLGCHRRVQPACQVSRDRRSAGPSNHDRSRMSRPAAADQGRKSDA